MRGVQIVLAVLEEGGRVLLERRPPVGLLAGMWAFPEAVAGEVRMGTAVDDDRARRSVLAAATDRGGIAVGEPVPLAPIEHRFTHMVATYEPWVVPVARVAADDSRAWVDPAAPNDLPVPVAQQKVLERLAALASRSQRDTAGAV